MEPAKIGVFHLISRGHSATAFEASEETLDPVAVLGQLLVVVFLS